jgi:hypothetical protein
MLHTATRTPRAWIFQSIHGWVRVSMQAMPDGPPPITRRQWLVWVALVAWSLLRSVARVVYQQVSGLTSTTWSATARQPTNSVWAPVSLDAPVVLIPGNMGDVSTTASALQACGIRAIDVATGPVSSCHDRACELFYALKGGRVDYGAHHSQRHGHRRYGTRHVIGQHTEWSEGQPVLLLCHSQGAMTALALLELLATRAFEDFETSAAWVIGVVTIAAPLSGVSWLHTLPLLRVPPPASSPCPACAQEESRAPVLPSTGGEAHMEERQGEPQRPQQQHSSQPVGGGLVGWSIVLGYILHVFLSWSSFIREHVWDWRIDQWHLCLRDVPALLKREHRLLRTTDTALYELTPDGARSRSRRLHTHAQVFYVAVPCQVTSGMPQLVVPSHHASPLHVCMASLGAVSSPCVAYRHSDGLVPTHAQRKPPGQPYGRLKGLSPPMDSHALDDVEECRRRRAALCQQLRPGMWLSGEAWCVDHGRSKLTVGSPTLDYALHVLLPAMCEARAEGHK